MCNPKLLLTPSFLPAHLDVVGVKRSGIVHSGPELSPLRLAGCCCCIVFEDSACVPLIAECAWDAYMQLQYYTFYSEKPAPYLSWLDLTSVQPIWDKLMRIKSSVTDIDLTCNSIVHHVRIGCSIVLWMPFAELHMQRCPLMWSRSQWRTNGVACLLSVGKVHYIMVNRTLGCGLSTRGVRLDWYIMKLCQIMLKDSWQWLSRIVATWLPNLCVQV